jgi:two-component system LytT family response regulator
MPDVRTLIVDDEPIIREGLRTFAERDGRLTLVGEGTSGSEALALVRRLRPDLLFLDVQMPELDGIDVIAALGVEVPPAVVFVTAFDQYAIRAFDLHAVDYLLKPFEEERFTVAVTRAVQRLESLPGAGAASNAPAVTQRLLVKDDGRVIVVPVAEIDWIEAADNYVKLHTAQRTWMLRSSIREVERQLAPAGFARAHRSAIVNLRRVRELQPLFGGESVILLHGGAKVTLSRGYRDTFRSRLELG